MNPITITLLTLVAWIIGAIIALFFSPEGGGAFTTLLGSFYFAPAACLVAFITSSPFYTSWIKNHKSAFNNTWALLIIWLLIVIVMYILT